MLAAVPFILLLLIALTYFAQLQGSSSPVDIHQLLAPFLPPHVHIGGHDPFAAIETLLANIAQNRDKLTLGGIRTALNDLYDVSVRTARRHFLVAYVMAKLRDITMVMVVVTLFLLNTALGTLLTVLQHRGEDSDRLTNFFLTSIGRGLGELVTIAFGVGLFFIVYRHASIRRLSWQSALIAASFAAVAFELAKRLFGLYLANIVAHSQFSLDANLGAVVLLILWIWYTSMVFLLGGVVAETWDLRARQQEQQAILT